MVNLVPASPPASPALTYLARLRPESRRTQSTALRVIAALVYGPGADPTAVPWHALAPAQASAVQARLIASYAPSTVRRMVAALRGVLHESWRLGLMTAECRLRVSDLPRVLGARLPAGRALTQGEIAALSSAGDLRDRALFLTMLCAGLRRGEAVRLRTLDVDVTGDLARFHVLGKGGNERRVYMSGLAVRALRDWLAARREVPGADPLGRLFLLLDGSSVWKRLASLARTARVARFGPHDLRRTYASRSLALGVDLATVQAAMGHADPRTTSRYDRRGEDAQRTAAERSAL